MKIKLSALALSLALVGGISQTAVASDIETDMKQQLYEKVDVGVSLLDTVRSGVIAYYSANMAWPANTSTLVSQQYIGTVTAPWSSAVGGSVTASGRSFTITLPAGSSTVAQGIAAKMAGVVSGSNVSIIIPIPAAAAINANNLSRIAVSGMPEVNRMFTDIDMNGNSLNSVNTVNAVLLNGTKAVLDDVVINSSLDVVPDANFRRAVTVGTDLTVANKVSSASVETNSLLVNGGGSLSGELSAGSVKSTTDVVAMRKVAGANAEFNTAVVNGGLSAVSASFDSATMKEGTATNFTVTTFKSLGVSDFAGDALFHGNVSINGALTVLGIASAKDIREGGVYLKDKYLGVGSKAKDSDKLDGLDSTAFAQLSKANNYTGINSYTQVLQANGGMSVDGKTVVSADGSTLYENGTALANKYLGKNAKAVSASNADNADKLDGLDSTAFAQLSKANNYTGINSYTQVLQANGGMSVDGKTVVSADGSTLYENGTALANKYLGKNAKAVSASNADYATNAGNANNANSLGGVGSSNYARTDVAETFDQNATFKSGLNISGGGLFVNGKRVVSNDGTTLYENGVALSDKYLGKTGTAYNSDRLGGVASSSYARTDVAETFTQDVTFQKAINIQGTSALMFSSYGGGWYMNDSSWIRAAGSKSIYTAGEIRADNGFSVDGKTVVSADGSTLYENGTALANKYLGKNAKAVSAANADNASKLGGVTASSYARRDASNSYSSVNTFNGGTNFNNTATFNGATVLNGTVTFKDSSGSSRTLSSLATTVDELDDWKAACQRDATSRDCGLALNNAVNSDFYGKPTTLFYNASGLDGGNFTLSQSYKNFRTIAVYGAHDNREQATVKVWTPEQLDFFHTVGITITIWHNDGESWTGRFDSTGRIFTTNSQNSRIYKVVGFN